MATLAERILNEVREAKSVQEALVVERNALRVQVEKLSTQLEQAGLDVAEAEAALEILDTMDAEGDDAIVANTDGTFTPSGNG